jgi:tRNA A-37 threonylcarbamoyl transferase component Bud32
MTRHRTADLDPTSFGGRYTLLRRLAVGGMAEIYLARQAAMAGFEKEVVIKRLRAELADDPRIVEMFLDEARIGALLNHPNIVHVYDVDEHDGIPYIAMEYIIGEELNELCRRGLAHDRFLPLEHAVELIRQAAAGMGAFHAARGTDGGLYANQPLEIVHLDISPSNLLVTQDGFLKIIDFGIANSLGQRQRTDVIPGKLAYMSPEQAARKEVDHRSDIFSLGIVLYEITVGKRLFRGPAQEVVGRLIEAQVEPPTFARRKFPTALEAIVMRTLEKHREDRYQSAYDLADDLEAFLREQRMHSGPVRIARYLDLLTAAAGGQRRPELVSEAEVRGNADDLDFDSQVFDGAYAPVEGAPGPDQAPEWEDTEQPEADVAAALGIGLAELRALRTPVPVRPAGMAAVSGHEPAREPASDDVSVTTNPVKLVEPRLATSEIDDGWDIDIDAPSESERAVTHDASLAQEPPPPGPLPHGPPSPAHYPEAPPLLQPPPSSGLPHGPPPPAHYPELALARPLPIAPTAGFSQRLPWILVGALGVAVLSLVAYIVLT